MKKIVALLLTIMLIASSVVGCNKSEAPKENKEKAEQTEKATRTFTDSAGRKVEIPVEISKVAPSGPIAQMVLYTINPDKLVGWSREPNETTKKYMDKKYWDLPSFGMFYGDTFNLEALMAAKPDVIIDIGEAKDSIATDMDDIQERTGIPTIFVEAKLDSTAEAYVTLGDLLSEEKQAKKLAEYSEKTMEDAKKFSASIPEDKRVKLYYGLEDNGLNTNGKGSFHAEIIDFVGIENVAVLDKVASKGGGNEVSMEQLLLWNPDMLLFAPDSAYEKAAAKDPLWKDLQAVQNGNVYEVPEAPYNWMSFPPAVNRILGVKWLGNLAYPDVFKYDMIKETKEFYQLFYHYDLTDEEAKELLKNSTLKRK
ncbi:ABC transporter substrate-binding protein [Bacillus sp. REN10]|uniref:ABC transporter substrate-binding protein n=1 Tax=Bacillus sp. REN10 TaxID=2782541 RepID=UPI00193BD0F8|nr:ABC transporter substrate-binding protein [Bacillus sp. REN10]